MEFWLIVAAVSAVTLGRLGVLMHRRKRAIPHALNLLAGDPDRPIPPGRVFLGNDAPEPDVIVNVRAELPDPIHVTTAKFWASGESKRPGIGDASFDKHFRIKQLDLSVMACLSHPARLALLELAQLEGRIVSITVNASGVVVATRGDGEQLAAVARHALRAVELMPDQPTHREQLVAVTEIALEDPCTPVRREAARLVLDAAPRGSAYAKRLFDGSPDVQTQVDAAAYIAPMPLSYLMDVARDPGVPDALRQRALRFLMVRRVAQHEKHGPVVIDVLLDLVTTAPDGLVADVLQALREAGVAAPLEILQRRFETSADRLRAELIQASLKSDAEAHGWLVEVLETQPLPTVALACCDVLQHIGRVEDVERLLKVTKRYGAATKVRAALKSTIAAIQNGRVSAVGALTVADGAQDGVGRLTDAARFPQEGALSER